ncbi:MAG: tetratricopeptide repeat protein [Bryobacteraceae bacterium]
MTNRLEALRQILAQNPSDGFARYGLAMEFSKAGRFQEAVAEFRALLDLKPDYAYAYYHAGQALERLGRFEEAKDFYRRGIELTARLGDEHARNELQLALDLLE